MTNRSIHAANNVMPSSLPQSLLKNPENVSRRTARAVPTTGQAIRVDINGDNFIDVVKATDISCGGLGVEVPHGFKGCNLNSLASVIIQLPHPVNEHITAKGRVIHINEEKFGISFVSISQSSEDKIQDYIDFQYTGHQSWFDRLGHWFGSPFSHT